MPVRIVLSAPTSPVATIIPTSFTGSGDVIQSRGGHSLVELVVALLLLELIGGAALAAAFTVERTGRRAEAGAATDLARWQRFRAVDTLDSCINAPMPDTLAFDFAATTERPAFRAVQRCGH